VDDRDTRASDGAGVADRLVVVSATLSMRFRERVLTCYTR
jgi:hypothetical protein